MTPEQFQAETALAAWIDTLAGFREDEDQLRVFGLTPASAADLTGEMIHGFRRLNLLQDVTGELKDMGYGLTVDRQAPAAAIVCSERINAFVTTLGAERLADGDCPVVATPDGGQRRVFAARHASDTADTLPEQQRATGEETWTDWVFSLDALFVGNAKDTDAGAVNIEQNLKLGTILKGLGDGLEAVRD